MITTHQNDKNDLEALIKSLEEFSAAKYRCFLCGKELFSGDYTQEPIIPQWAQKRYQLWDQHLVLLNETSIPYRQLTVPCCDECNRNRLKPVEDSLSQAVERGREAVKQLGHKILFIWLGKILYGLLYKELTLLVDRSDPSAGSIITPDIIQRYRMHRFFLQQVKDVVECVDFCPGSIHIFSAQELPDKRFEWDFCDNVDTMFIGCRAGKTALISCLADGGAEQSMEPQFSDISNIDLHPIQIREICAIVSYRSTLATRTPKHLLVDGNPHKACQVPLGGFSTKPYFEGWDDKAYSKYLAVYLGEKENHFFQPPDKVMTWLRDERGNPRFIDFKDFPVLPENIVGAVGSRWDVRK